MAKTRLALQPVQYVVATNSALVREAHSIHLNHFSTWPSSTHDCKFLVENIRVLPVRRPNA